MIGAGGVEQRVLLGVAQALVGGAHAASAARTLFVVWKPSNSVCWIWTPNEPVVDVGADDWRC